VCYWKCTVSVNVDFNMQAFHKYLFFNYVSNVYFVNINEIEDGSDD
jgi:hypothetical protein